MASFDAQVRKFTEEQKRNIPLIFVDSVAKLEEELKRNRKNGGGLTPVDTGNLIRSISTSDKTMPKVDSVEKQYTEVEFSLGPSAFGKPVYIGVQAVYGPRMIYGFQGTDSLGRNYNQAGAFFVEGAAAKWVQFVNEVEALYNGK